MIDIDKAFENRWRIKSDGLEDDECRRILGKKIKELCRDFFEAGLALGARDYVPLNKLNISMEMPLTPDESLSLKDKHLFDRSIPFNQSVFTTENIQKYGQQMLQDFYEYWTEPNPSHTKMRFELQKTWDVNRRLARWARNNFNRYDRQQPTKQQQDISKLASILTD